MKNYPYYVTPEIRDLKDMLNKSVKLYADKAAFLVKDKKSDPYRKITYKEYGEQVNALGTALIAAGYKDKRIAVIGENSYSWALTYMAVINGVGVIVPIDKELPANEILNMLNRSESSVVVYSKKLGEKIKSIYKDAASVQQYICMAEPDEEINASALSELVEEGKQLVQNGDRSYIDAEIDLEKMCALLFTSGTTAEAKAVMLCQRNITRNVDTMGTMLNVREDVLLSVLPMHHTYECTCGFLYQIYRGSTVAFCDGLKYIQKNMKEAGVTVMLAVPLLVENMYRKIWENIEKDPATEKKVHFALKLSNALLKVGIDVRKKLFAQIHDSFGGHLRLLICGAAGVDPKVAKGLREFGIMTVQGYGLTECAPIIALNRDKFYKDDAAGYPMTNVEIKINMPNEDGIGEIIAKGPNVMLGYYENEAATNEVIKDGWFYTGDLGYIDEDGFVHITGRKKNLIITKNGKNVYPEEIEEMINALDTVLECMVYGEEDESGETRIAVQIYPDREKIAKKYGIEAPDNGKIEELLTEEIKEINRKLVSYKAVKKIVVRDEEFKKTTTQKIKRYANAVKKDIDE